MKKADTLHKLWVKALRGEDRARSMQEQLRLQEEGECKSGDGLENLGGV